MVTNFVIIPSTDDSYLTASTTTTNNFAPVKNKSQYGGLSIHIFIMST